MLRAADWIPLTHTGLQRRENEDSVLASPPVFVVADGMGGAQAGEVASRIAVDAFAEGLPEDGSPEERLAAVALTANKRIYDVSRTESERAGMGTTLTAAYLGENDLAIAHVGDSRAYLFRDGELTRLTQDHSLMAELIRRGKLTEEEAADHPQRSIITRALGPEPEVTVDTWTYPVRAADVILLCSDGLTSMIPEAQVADILRSADSLERAAQALIDEANRAGGRDNITVILFRLEEVGSVLGTDQPTVVAAPSIPSPSSGPTANATGVAVAPPPGVTRPAPVARTQRPPSGSAGPPPSQRRRGWRYSKPMAALLAVVIVLFLFGGGGWLATRQLYFLGTDARGFVTIYRGLPYGLVAGVRLYEPYYQSGVPASTLPPAERGQILNHSLRSQGNAQTLVNDLELGKVQR
ncbi:MAG TPA: Stp1/IreP family PP2C-type Ser/Thr phosphatase [Solirubrobacteraceae bacterium]|jgi:protein phosphatase|nr:Stp1/IreP family PP2C-type Ser/Thr phosphatase [Solirubrobacteraceae bacterium]